MALRRNLTFLRSQFFLTHPVDIVDIVDSRYLYLQPAMFNGDNERLMTLMTSVQITD